MPPVTVPGGLFFDHLPTPVGEAVMVWDGEATLRALDWLGNSSRMSRLLARYYGAVNPVSAVVPKQLADALKAYFDGDLGCLNAIAYATDGTFFQREVWAAVRGIPAGTTLSCGALAQRIGRPAAVRAVGMASGANPIGLAIPCHRVIGANGALTGYGAGIDRKRWLLRHEGVAIG